MCEFIAGKIKNEDGTTYTTLLCKYSNKPPAFPNDYGLFCEDMCDFEECQKGGKQLIEKFMNTLVAYNEVYENYLESEKVKNEQ